MYRKCSTEVSVQNQRKVTAALVKLMQETPYEDITVSSLCQCAGITRRIFYHLFSNKTDALYALIDHVILGNEGAANWFTAMGSTELEDDSPMEFPEGKMSVKTTIGDIYKNPEAWEFFSKMSGGKMGPDMPMWAMMQNFNLETLMGMMGSTPEGALKALNKQLNAFDPVD